MARDRWIFFLSSATSINAIHESDWSFAIASAWHSTGVSSVDQLTTYGAFNGLTINRRFGLNNIDIPTVSLWSNGIPLVPNIDCESFHVHSVSARWCRPPISFSAMCNSRASQTAPKMRSLKDWLRRVRDYEVLRETRFALAARKSVAFHLSSFPRLFLFYSDFYAISYHFQIVFRRRSIFKRKKENNRNIIRNNVGI